MTTVKVIELVGTSTDSWEAAAQVAVTEAARTVRGISGVEVTNQTATVKDGKISQYRSTVKVAFIHEA